MYSKRDLLITVLLVIAGLFVVAGTQPAALSSPAQAEMPKGPGAEWRLVVVGDASLVGLGDAFAEQIARDVGVKVDLDDFALYDLPADALLQALQTGTSPMVKLEHVISALRNADVVVVSATENVPVSNAP